MSRIYRHRAHGYGAAVTATAVSFVVGAIVILWSWNTVAVGLFGAPNVAIRHAIAIELAMVVVCMAIGLTARLARGGRHNGARA